MKILIATNNTGKLREFKAMLMPLGFDAVSLKDAGISAEVVEDGTTFLENARKKALEIKNLTDYSVAADDSGLAVDYLNGEPGVYSARYGGAGLNDAERNKIILKKLKNVPKIKRTARFISIIYYTDGKNDFFSEGIIEGHISEEPMGENGFGYDPIFLPEGYDGKTSMAMLSDDEKNKISHRSKALTDLIKTLERGVNI